MIDQVKISLSIDGEIPVMDKGPFRCIDYDSNGVSVGFSPRNAIEIHDAERRILDSLLSTKSLTPRSSCLQLSIYFSGGQRNFSIGDEFMGFLASRGISLDISAYDS